MGTKTPRLSPGSQFPSLTPYLKMPTLNKINPQETIDHANKVIKAALAPFNPSSQDYKVASRARAIKSEAQNLQANKRLDYYA